MKCKEQYFTGSKITLFRLTLHGYNIKPNLSVCNGYKVNVMVGKISFFSKYYLF